MYQNKFIVFVDILGFGALVERSGATPGLAESILDTLLSMNPDRLQETMYGSLNEEKIPKDELAGAKEALAIIHEHMSNHHHITISYFSDSLVLSADDDNIIASQSILELLAKLSIELWNNYSLLIRGGMTLGKLVHNDNGPIFGPAMNRAYFLESEEANTPRIIIDEHCIDHFQKVSTFSNFESLIEKDDNYSYISLPACFRYTTTASSLCFSESSQLEIVESAQTEVLQKIRQIISSDLPQKVKDKYIWLEAETIRTI